MKKNKYILLFLIGLAVIICSVNEDRSIISRLTEKLNRYSEKFPQEKVYLHIDKNIYQPGDSLWFKAYIVDYSTHKSSEKSNTLFTAIIDGDGEIVLEKKSLIADGAVWGDFILPAVLKEGYYKIISYTSWMKNYDVEDVYTKDIQIKLFIPKELYLSISFYDSVYKPGEEVKAEIRTYGIKNKAVAKVRYKYQLTSKNNIIHKGNGITSEEGIDSIRFVLPEDGYDLNYILNIIALNEEESSLITRIPTIFSNLDLQFFPEGGDLVPGLESRVAFKALNLYGESIDIEGELIDQNNIIITSIKSVYKGMGIFTITPEEGISYRVRVNSPDLIEKVYPLPDPVPVGFVLSVENTSRDSIRLRVKTSNIAKQERIAVLVQIRGIKYWGIEGIINNEAIIYIPTKDMPMGIAQITLFNSKAIPVAERLVFVNKHKRLNILANLIKTKFYPREKVELVVRLKDEKGDPLTGNLSFSAVDIPLCINSSIINPTILTSVLLESELKGTIPAPNFYFDKDSPLSNLALDLVMMTHGWRRFSWDKVINQNIDELYSPRDYDIISGTVYKTDTYWRIDKQVPNATVTITQMDPPDFAEIRTDEKGRFDFKLRNYDPRGINIGLTATSLKGKKNVRIALDEKVENLFLQNFLDSFAGQKEYLYNKSLSSYNIKKKPEEVDDGIIDLGDTKLIPGVVITAKRIVKKVDPWFERAKTYNANTIRGEELPEHTINFEHILRKVRPLVYFFDDTVYFSRLKTNYPCLPIFLTRREPMLFMINEVSWGYYYSSLSFLSSDDIEFITAVDPCFGYYQIDPRAVGGAFLITTKKDYWVDNEANENFAYINILAPLREFYSPKYETKEEKKNKTPDLRTTIHWDPNIQTDSLGVAKITFYNADRQTRIMGIIEGLSENGILGTTRFRYEVKSDTTKIYID